MFILFPLLFPLLFGFFALEFFEIVVLILLRHRFYRFQKAISVLFGILFLFSPRLLDFLLSDSTSPVVTVAVRIAQWFASRISFHVKLHHSGTCSCLGLALRLVLASICRVFPRLLIIGCSE